MMLLSLAIYERKIPIRERGTSQVVSKLVYHYKTKQYGPGPERHSAALVCRLLDVLRGA